MKKSIFAVGCLTVLAFNFGGTVLASENSNESHIGSEVIYEDTGVTSTIVRDNAGPKTRASDGRMDGGWWYRGKVGSRLVSEYKHYSKQGRGSCRNGNGTYNDGGWKKAGIFSKSSVGYTSFGGNKVYYDYK